MATASRWIWTSLPSKSFGRWRKPLDSNGAAGMGLGADEKVAQRVLRHAKSHVTKDRYIKAFDPAVLAAMKKMETTLDALAECAPAVHQMN